MGRTVNVHEAKTNLSKLLEAVEHGEEITIARAGVPCAKLVPIAEPPKKKREFGFMKGHIPDSFFEPLPEEELALWESVDELLLPQPPASP